MSSVLSREEIIGKIVIDASGNEVGKVSDIGVSLTGEGILKVQTSTGEQVDIPMTRVQAIGKYVILKPEIPPPPTAQPLPQQSPPPPPPPQQEGFKIPFLSKPPPPPPPSSGMKVCPRCGATNPPDARFCRMCGAPLQ
ncbi:MAG: hypothetical protein DRJ35_07485 [Thermoprotei archaeon]|nr:MAG: hypothetical protein DRJ35_07485 [Thermoprotei archaeon]